MSKFVTFQTSAQIPHEEDSLDAEDIFDLEGTDSRNYMASDQDDYDSDRKLSFKIKSVVKITINTNTC